MFERYTERARRVIFFARYEASQLGSAAIETEHVLLGLIREGKGLTSRLFSKSHLSMDQIRKEVEGRSPYRDKVSTSIEIPLSLESKRVLGHAAEEAERMLHNYIGTEHILLGLMREERSVAAGILSEKGMRLASVREDILALLNEKAQAGKSKETPLLSEFSRDLTEAAARNALDPLVGRDEELERVIQVLCRRTRNNPVLIGEPGVGKTALVEGLANKIVQGDVPVYLADKRILALDISLIVAGTKYRGQFEERLKTIMRELTETPNIVIFIDELHTLVGRRLGRGLARRGEHPEARALARRDPVHRRDHARRVPQAHREGPRARAALPGRQGRLADRGGDGPDPARGQGALREVPQRALPRRGDRGGGLPVQPLHHRPLPARQGDRPDRRGGQPRQAARGRGAGAASPSCRAGCGSCSSRTPASAAASSATRRAQSREQVHVLNEQWALGGDGRQEVTKLDIDEVVSRWTGIPITALKEEESEKLLRMEEELHRRIVSQDGAISAVARAIRRTRAGLKNPNRPVGSFLFLGPDGRRQDRGRARPGGVPVRQRAQPVRFDMSEYMEKHSVTKLIGSPPGYVGHEEGGQLTERVKRNPYCVVLLDEIEKAHPDVFNVLLQVFEDGHLTDGLGNTVDFKNTILIMTSNIGARFIEKKGRMGFASASRARPSPPPTRW